MKTNKQNISNGVIKIKKIWIILASALMAMPLSAYAFSLDLFDGKFFDAFAGLEESRSAAGGDGKVMSEIIVSASTGNNAIGGEIDSAGDKSSGETERDKLKTGIEIKSIINGKEINPIEIKSEADKVKVKSKIEADEEKARVQTETEIDSVKKSENYETDLKNPAWNIMEEKKPGESGKEEMINNNKESSEKALGFPRNRWSEFAERLKSFFRNIFNIF